MLRNRTYLLLENNLFVIALICLTRPCDFYLAVKKIFLKYTKSFDRAVSEGSLMRTSISCWLELKKSLILEAMIKRCVQKMLVNLCYNVAKDLDLSCIEHEFPSGYSLSDCP